MISVMLVDDHAMVRAGFRSMLGHEPDIQVVAEAESGESAYGLYFEQQPDVLVLDISMPGEGGIGLLYRLLARDAQACVLMMSMHDDAAFIRRTLEAGAKGYISKSDDAELLVEAIRALVRGENWLSPGLTRQLAACFHSHHADPVRALTDRELEVFLLLARGYESKKIAEMLHLSPKTVGTHQTRVFQKLGMHTSAELARLAIRLDMIQA